MPTASTVAVIGAGPGGLVTARWLAEHGLIPTIFEGATDVGGQWTGECGRSGVWPGMHTNTSRVLTAFSDLEPEVSSTFPSATNILGYLHRYAEKFDLLGRIRYGSTVINVRPAQAGWIVETASGSEHFGRVVIATGRFTAPAIPPVDGLASFTGEQGVISTFDFRGASSYAGKRVLVAGCAVSALEIATELVGAGASVVLTQRRQRYVLPKFAAGVPSDHRIFTRYGALASDLLPAMEVERQLKEIVLEAGGSPEQYGAPAPDPSLFTAGVTLSQHYLPLVAEGRITIRPWLQTVRGRTVTFADSRHEDVDGIIFGTGFGLSIPLLDNTVRKVLDIDDMHIDLDRSTFHPDLPGLAFVGMWDQSGGYFVPLELQARWIAYSWAGVIDTPSDSAQRDAVHTYRVRRGLPQKSRMNLMALTFARAAGVEPTLGSWPDLRRALLFGPLAPSCFRLQGPDALDDAPARLHRDAAAFGAITTNALTERESAYYRLIEPR